ncbi:hypothetical protein Tsac_2875 [Thermoanaerobacterium phage THSA-485A]|uniref:hypothetical protein n=1 Tax=Thermoanaerobacterium phage THSA-485A TaxID=1126885 RepID=UPI000263F8E3|nr:hypothetical protein Tsac_2875 [Thermoanaerobacterium phage THSA-485A]AFK87728.1 hypothetical protein Tsac_2875 [Thermoanaerobacterium phage THSA-485A]
MSIGNFKEELSLSNVCSGALEEEFKKIYPTLVSNLKQGDKASINISIDFQRVADTDTMISVNYKITPKMPGRSKKSICQVKGDNKLLTDEVVKENVENMTIDELIKNNVVEMKGVK